MLNVKPPWHTKQGTDYRKQNAGSEKQIVTNPIKKRNNNFRADIRPLNKRGRKLSILSKTESSIDSDTHHK
jgi:hypothetical protein